MGQTSDDWQTADEPATTQLWAEGCCEPMASDAGGRPRVSLIDLDDRRRAALSHFLSGEGVEVVPFDSVPDLIARRRGEVPVLIADQDDAVAVLMGALKASGQWMPVIAYAEQVSLPRVVDTVRQGALDYLVWPFSADAFSTALRSAEEPAAVSAGFGRNGCIASSKVSRLSGREKEVLFEVARGRTSREIGQELGISARTVEKHRENIQVKLEARNNSDLVRIATEFGL